MPDKAARSHHDRGIWEVDLNPVTALALDAAVIQFHRTCRDDLFELCDSGHRRTEQW